MTRSVFFVVSLMVAGHQIFAQSNLAAPTDSDVQKRHTEYFQLNRQIYTRHEDPGSGQLSDAKAAAASEKLHEMISSEIDRALADPKPSERRVGSAIAALQGDLSLNEFDTETANTPFVKFFSLNGIQSVAISYAIIQGGDAIPDTQTYLDFYDNASGVWRKKTTAPTVKDFEGCTYFVSQLRSGLPGEAWFFAWGVPIGSTRSAARARLYAFDGFTVRTIWKRDLLAYAKVKVTPDTVSLDYSVFDDMGRFIEDRDEAFHVTANGLE